MQALRHQVALLDHGKLPIARDQPLVFDRHAQLAAQRFDHALRCRIHRLLRAKVQIKQPQFMGVKHHRKHHHLSKTGLLALRRAPPHHFIRMQHDGLFLMQCVARATI